ncbi:MAG: family 78 glycoside hydrolase catalytic domain, partial [Solobacterium sp.]|nr:family 78 glycoside hydrolase catalytic domain [Solobacterium sp.]
EGELIETEGEPIREKEVFAPVAILSQNDGTSVLDFGQNIAGYMEFTVTGQAGEEAEMVYGEVLDQDGQFTQSNLSFAKNRQTGKYPQTVVYKLKEGTQTWKPQASVHGFRYVKLTGWPEEVKAENFRAIAVYSDLKQTGSFECSDPLINRLASNCRWSMKGNYLDIPTDCPTRERAGWTGDAMVYCVPAAYQMDIYRFTKKWLKDVILEQNPDGSIRNIVPDGGMPVFMDGAAGWSDAIVKIPYELYRFYGKKEILEMCWPAIRRHITFMENRASMRKPWHLNKGAHYDYVIDTGFHWGEWLEPGTSMPAGALKGFTVPDAEVATAYYAWSAGKAAEIAGILGRKEDELYCRQLHEKVKAAYQKEFLPHGIPESDRQCRFVRPLALGLARQEDCSAIAAKLNEMILKNGCRIGTGFLSTPHVCRVLSDYGYTETAWRLLENKEQPGWLYEVRKGATTIWENWYGLDQKGKPVNSWNHYSPGAVIAWLYDSAAGITPLKPGFEKIRIAPKPGGSLTSLNVSFDSAAGLISVRWEKEGNHVKLIAETPAETEIILPDGTEETVPAGSYEKEFDII